MDKPDVDSIEGLSPCNAIGQGTTTAGSRSTVGTMTEINDYLRVRLREPVCRTVPSTTCRVAKKRRTRHG